MLLPFGSGENRGGQSSWVLTPWKCVISSRILHGLVSLTFFRLQSILLLCITELFVKCIRTKAAGFCWGWSESLASIPGDTPLPPLVCKGAAARPTVLQSARTRLILGSLIPCPFIFPAPPFWDECQHHTPISQMSAWGLPRDGARPSFLIPNLWLF